MSTVNALFHIVISTKYRKMTLTSVYRKDLYRYVVGDRGDALQIAENRRNRESRTLIGGFVEQCVACRFCKATETAKQRLGEAKIYPF